jgi:FtsH-binding integral membrane protein
MSAPDYAPPPGPPPRRDQGSQNYYATENPTSYTHAPPAYGDDEALLRGSPRNSEDDIPDDFKYSTNIAEATIDIRHAFIRKVYAILTVQLLATAVVSSVSFFSENFKFWIQTNAWMMFVAIFGSLGFLFATYWKRKSYPTNLAFLSVFTLLESYSIAVITSFYDSKIVLQAVIITGGLFLALTVFAMQTKYDFSSWYSYLYGALWLLIIFGFVAMFFPHNGWVELAYSGVAALLFSAYILVDTQLILRRMMPEEEIAAAISLYLDILNLFLAILRILNATSDN